MPFRWVESPEEQSESHLALGLSPGTAGWLISNATLQSAGLPLIVQVGLVAVTESGHLQESSATGLSDNVQQALQSNP